MDWKNWFRRRESDERELDEEIQAHLAIEARERMEAGESEREAWRGARRDFGNVPLIKDVTREMWGWNSWDRLRQDVRYALRGLGRSPGFTAVALVALALGIGANTAIFSVVDALMLKMLPVSHPEQLVELLTVFGPGNRFNAFSWPAYKLLRDNNTVFSGLMACPTDSFRVTGGGARPERVEGQYVTGNYFPVLGVKPVMGRLIGVEDDRPGSPNPVAVISYGYWKSRFALDPSVMGKQVRVEDVPVTIVGVTPPAFYGLQVGRTEEISIPLEMEPLMRRESRIRDPGSMWLRVLGRLKPGVSVAQAHTQASALFHETLPERARHADTGFRQMVLNWKLDVVPAGAGLARLRDVFGRPLTVLMAMVGVVLLIACANVATLLVARGATRRREIAVRVSLGASRIRIVRQLLTESLLLAVAGATLGAGLAWVASKFLVALMSSGRLPFTLEIQPDFSMLLFSGAMAVLTALVFGLMPAIRAGNISPAVAMKEAGRGAERSLKGSLGTALVVSQVALSVVLLGGAGLFMRSLRNLESVDLGFHRDRVLLVTLDTSGSKLSNAQHARLYRDLLQRLETIPGVQAASLSWIAPIAGGGVMSDVSVEGYTPKPDEGRTVYLNSITPRYFETLGTPLVAGRDFRAGDSERPPKLAIVNQTMARYYFGSANPLGRHVTIDGSREPLEIIGVAGDAKYLEIRESTPRTLYLDAFQDEQTASEFLIRTKGNPSSVVADVQRAVREVGKDVPIARVTTLSRHVDASIVQERMLAALSAAFGLLGLFLASLGLYGLLAYAVARRTNEIGIRMAIGAARKDVIRMVLGDALLLTSAGLGIGIVLTLAVSRVVASQLYGLTAHDPMTLTAAAVTLVAVAFLASYLPARRASRVDPMNALRYE